MRHRPVVATSVEPALVVSLHDVAPATLDAARRWTDHLDARGVPATILAVPGPWRGPALDEHRPTGDWLWVRECGGDEIALHGWAHRVERRGPGVRAAVGRGIARGAEEFWSLDGRQAAARTRRGLDVLASIGLHPVGFTPPGWLISAQARHAVLSCGLAYVADHVSAATRHRRLRAPALSHRPGALGQRAGATTMRTIARRRIRAGLPVRIALHPADLDHPDLVDTTLAVLDDALAHGARPSTYRAELGLATARSRP